MRSYEDISNRIMERGDKLIEERKVRAAKIRHTSYAVSGMCAAAIAGIGVWHIASNVKKPDDGFKGSDIISATEVSAEKTATTADITKPVTTTAENTTTTAKTTAVTTDKKSTDTTAAVPAATTAARTTAVATSGKTVRETGTVPYSAASPATTSTDTHIAVTTTANSRPTSTGEECVRTTIVPNGTEEGPVTTASNIEESAVVKTVTTTVPTGAKGEYLTESTAAPVTTTTSVQDAFRANPTYITVKGVRYEKQGVVSADETGEYMGRVNVHIQYYRQTIREVMKAYTIDGVSAEEALAVQLKDTDEYYLFRNASYRKEE